LWDVNHRLLHKIWEGTINVSHINGIDIETWIGMGLLQGKLGGV
jgi:hypothetical protein